MSERHAGHVVPIKIYLAVFASLMLLTAVTVWASGQDFGPYNTLVALSIAVAKASLVVLFFMHVKYSSRLVQIVVVSSLLWLVILLSVVGDYVSRGWLGNPGT